MPFNPELKKNYDKNRYAKQKEEYIKNNPDYIPVRIQQKIKREELLKSSHTTTDSRSNEINNISLINK